MIPSSPRILVIKLRYLGDVLLTIPVFDALRNHFPDAFIAAAVNKGTEDMLTGNPAVNKIFTVEKDSNFLSDLRTQLILIRAIRNFKFDMVLELTNNDRGAVLAYVSGAKRRLGYKKKKENFLRQSILFTDLIEVEKNLHIAKKNLEMAKALECPLPAIKPVIFWSPQDQAACEQILKDNSLSDDIPYIVLHPSSNARHKIWTVEGYAALCNYLRDKWAIRTILICGKDPEELRLNREICALAKSHPLNLGGQLTLKQTAVLLSKAALFIGIDSGPMHMATAVNKPVAAIFGPSRAWRWGPLGEGHVIIQKDWPCVPCGKKGCEGNGQSRCLDELSLEEVTAVLEPKLKSILSAKGRISGEKMA
ncbi:MAG TPA: putative lipopolysaccharide heptosyltransferase III [Smithella sp.]|nr:putative lipopolysaccharide heptosyltransferase III [Smithella sp.]HNY51189.1 putative lipopolysaccharide heptosyltransferase III [Smithella sp.]HOG90560.1 putative lipopolysaccharide heptosyltransferase III [Smithella sp.]HOU52252.1 putative lipopolysaccharide heptosyltransferase III [Smithella sp.]HQH17755.1 putative lipopolysaccharide heptosyltransferase III [Smithella sp.]